MTSDLNKTTDLNKFESSLYKNETDYSTKSFSKQIKSLDTLKAKYSNIFEDITIVNDPDLLKNIDNIYLNKNNLLINSVTKKLYGDDNMEKAASDVVGDISDYYRSFNGKGADKIINQNISNIYVIIEYPVINKAVIKFSCKIKITYGFLLYVNTIAYQLMYDIEDEDVGCQTKTISANSFNRASSNGRFGIYGHYITDLVYNSNYKISARNENIYCQFDCDS